MWSIARIELRACLPETIRRHTHAHTNFPHSVAHFQVHLWFWILFVSQKMIICFYFVWNISKFHQNGQNESYGQSGIPNTKRKTLPRKWWCYCHACLLRFFCLSKCAVAEIESQKSTLSFTLWTLYLIEMWFYCVFSGTGNRPNPEHKKQHRRIRSKWEKKHATRKKRPIHFIALLSLCVQFTYAILWHSR